MAGFSNSDLYRVWSAITSTQTQTIFSAGTQTIQGSAVIYQTGYQIGSVGSIANVGNGILQNIAVELNDTYKPSFTLHLFTNSLAATGYTDNTPLVISNIDRNNYIGCVNVTSSNWQQVGVASATTYVAMVTQQALAMNTSNNALNYVIEARSNNISFSGGTAVFSLGILA